MPDALDALLLGPGPIVAVQGALGRGWIPLADVVSLVGDSWGVVLAAGLARWLWGRGAAWAVITVVALEAVVSLALNQVFHLPRPSDPRIWVREEVMLASFPSGHVFLTTVLAGTLATIGRLPAAAAAALVLLVGFSRIYLGMHFVGDVLGGIVFALLLLAVFVRLWPWLRRTALRVPAGAWTGIAAVALLAAAAAFVLVPTDNFQVFESIGIVGGAAAALLLEARTTRQPDAGGVPAPAWATVSAGVAGIALCLPVDRAWGDTTNLLLTLPAAASMLWALHGVPRLFATRRERESVRTA